MFSISSAAERGSVAREPAAQDDAIPRRPQEIKIKRAESRGARGVVNPHQWAAEPQIVLKILRERANRGFIVDIRVEHTRRPRLRRLLCVYCIMPRGERQDLFHAA